MKLKSSGGYHTVFRSVKHVPSLNRRQNGELFHVKKPSQNTDASRLSEVAQTANERSAKLTSGVTEGLNPYTLWLFCHHLLKRPAQANLCLFGYLKNISLEQSLLKIGGVVIFPSAVSLIHN